MEHDAYSINHKCENSDQPNGMSQASAVGLPQVTPSTSPIPPQGNSLNDIQQKEFLIPTTDIDKKIKFWKKLALILGSISFLGYILVIVGANILAHETKTGSVIFILFSVMWLQFAFVLFILSLVSLVRIIVLSRRRKKHVFKDYVIVVTSLILIAFSPFVIGGFLSFFSVSQNEDDNVTVTLESNDNVSVVSKLKDPYYLSGSLGWSGSSYSCSKEQITSTYNNSKALIDEYSHTIDEETQKMYIAKTYVETVGEEILCQIGEFYRGNKRYPNEDEIEVFSSNAVSDDLRNGIYNIKLEVGSEPNDKDFTILFDKNCVNNMTIDGNIAVLSPLYYGNVGRYCVYTNIDGFLDDF